MRLILALICLLALGCDVHQEKVDAWYANRYPRPGEAAVIELGVHRVLRGQVLKVEAESRDLGLPATVVFNDEQAPGFGMLLTVKRDDKVTVQVVQVPVAAHVAPGPAEVTLRVRYRAAEYSGPSQFKVTSGEDTLRLQVRVVHPGFRGWLERGIDLLLPLALLVGVGLACGALNPLGTQGRWRAMLMVILGAAWCATIFGGFIQPVSWVFGLTTGWVRALVGALGLGFGGAIAAAMTEHRADRRRAP